MHVSMHHYGQKSEKKSKYCKINKLINKIEGGGKQFSPGPFRADGECSLASVAFQTPSGAMTRGGNACTEFAIKVCSAG